MEPYYISPENRRTGVCEMQKGLEKWTTNLGLCLLINHHIKDLTYLPDVHFQTTYIEPAAQNNPPNDADLACIEGCKIRHRAVVTQQVKLQDQYCQHGFVIYFVIQKLTDDSILTDCKNRNVKWAAASAASD